MSSFSDRLSFGEQHEKRVRAELEERGWEVTPWGQAIVPEFTRRVIHEAAPKFGHEPDLVAARAGEFVAIDAKDRMHSTETGRYAVSRSCVDFGLQYVGAFGVPLFYVFGNLGVLCPTEIRSYGMLGPRATGGAYYLVPERLAHHFDDVFGSPAQMAA